MLFCRNGLIFFIPKKLWIVGPDPEPDPGRKTRIRQEVRIRINNTAYLDNKRPVSSDFTLRKRKSPLGNIWWTGQVGIVLMSWPPLEPLG